jgi:hypothetical protein
MRRNVRTVQGGLTIVACILALVATTVWLSAPALGRTGRPTAKEAKTIDLVESASLELVHEEGSELTEHGHATGTYNAPVSATFTIHPKSVTALVTVYPRGGSITGTAHANYVVQNSYGYFGGAFTVTHGTGTYRHASGKALGFSGTINRYTFAATVKAHGEVSY